MSLLYCGDRGRIARLRHLLLLPIVLGIASCGGGSTGTGATSGSSGTGGSSSGGSGSSGSSTANNASMSVSPLSISVSATTAQAAPTATFQVTINGLQSGQEVYVGGTYTDHGIATLSDAGGYSPITVTIQFQSPATLGAGVYNDTVTMTGCYDQACTQPVTGSPQTVQVQYTVTDTTVKLTALSPSSAVASGPAFTLAVTGSNFTAQSIVQWNGAARTTSYVSSTQLSAQINAADIAAPGTASVSVNDPVNGPSNPLTFTILVPQLALDSISPTTVAAGGPGFMLTVLGAGFTGTSTVLWNGSPRSTTLVSSSELVAQVTAADIASPGTASVAVQDPSSSVGTTPAQTVTISPASIDAVAFQMNAAHTGSVNFSSMSFPSSAAWSVDVGGTPSYALLVDGEVIVTVKVGSSSQLVALDQATGATLWGPISIAGNANATYDSGSIFVLSSPLASAATLEAFDAKTGSQLWSTLLTGQYSFTGAPTAANGMVYVGGAGSGGTLYAVDETNGAIVWTQPVENGDISAPAVTADGVYVTYPCWTYDFRPATGESIWNNNTGCDGGGGATPVVANQRVYSPNGIVGNNGSVYDAETGSNDGTYAADSPPAFTATTGYFLQSGTLRGISVSNNTVEWSFAGDGQLAGAPIAVNQYVFIGSSSGNLYALDGTSGQQLWQVSLPAPVVAADEVMPFSGLAAGDGLLVVPAGTQVTAYVLSTNP